MKYNLRCVEGREAVEDRYTNACPSGHHALLRTEYARERLNLRDLPGIFRFCDWLPVEEVLPLDARPVTYRSREFARELGLTNLDVGFSGYWPERGGSIPTCTFKELEAIPTLLRLQEKGAGTLVVASAGNTGRAFAQISAVTGIPVVLVVPEANVARIWTTEPADAVFLIAVDGDYSDAIEFADRLTALGPLVAEGGAKNVARRDGMGTVMLDAAVTAGRIPDHYFQAVGSGTGAIAAWEACLRLRRDGRFGARLPRLHLCQNLPFIPLVHAWQDRRRHLIPALDMFRARETVRRVHADVLTNRNPPYGIRGGLFDALSDTDGTVSPISNDAARIASRLFEGTEGIDLDPAAAVNAANLIEASEAGVLDPKSSVLLNVTGGGYERVKEDYCLLPLAAACTVRAGASLDAVRAPITEWLRPFEAPWTGSASSAS